MSGVVHTVRDLIGIPALEKVLLLVIASHADENGVAWPSNERLAATTGMDIRSVKRKLKLLEERGLINMTYSGTRLPNGKVHVSQRNIHLTDHSWPHRLDPKARFEGVNEIELSDLKSDHQSPSVPLMGQMRGVNESGAEPIGPNHGLTVQLADDQTDSWCRSQWDCPPDPQNYN